MRRRRQRIPTLGAALATALVWTACTEPGADVDAGRVASVDATAARRVREAVARIEDARGQLASGREGNVRRDLEAARASLGAILRESPPYRLESAIWDLERRVAAGGAVEARAIDALPDVPAGPVARRLGEARAALAAGDGARARARLEQAADALTFGEVEVRTAASHYQVSYALSALERHQPERVTTALRTAARHLRPLAEEVG